MAEKKFIIDNGFSTDADSEITGSLTVSGTVDASAFTVNGSPLSSGSGSTNLPLNGLTDVAASSPNDGDVIQYDSANNKWVTAAPASGGSSYGDSDVSTFLNGNIDGHLIPDTNITYDLGSPEKKFRYLYLDSSTMFLGDTPFSASNVDHSMEVYVDQPAPVSSTAEGKKGDVRVVGGFMYICVDTNTWVRSPVDTNW